MCLHAVGHGIQHLHEAGIVVRLAVAVGRGQRHQAPLHVVGEDIAVVQLEAVRSPAAHQLGNNRCE